MRTTIRLAPAGAGLFGGDLRLAACLGRQRRELAGQLVQARVAACPES